MVGIVEGESGRGWGGGGGNFDTVPERCSRNLANSPENRLNLIRRAYPIHPYGIDPKLGYFENAKVSQKLVSWLFRH